MSHRVAAIDGERVSDDEAGRVALRVKTAEMIGTYRLSKKPGNPQAFMNWPHECTRRSRTGGA